VPGAADARAWLNWSALDTVVPAVPVQAGEFAVGCPGTWLTVVCAVAWLAVTVGRFDPSAAADGFAPPPHAVSVAATAAATVTLPAIRQLELLNVIARPPSILGSAPRRRGGYIAGRPPGLTADRETTREPSRTARPGLRLTRRAAGYQGPSGSRTAAREAR
jgi:hypothetical protein